MRTRRLLGWAFAVCLVGCGDDDPVATPPPSDEKPTFDMSSELSELEPALLAVTSIGSDETDLLAVGGPLVGDGPPALMRRQGDSWSAVSPPSGWRGAIWWAWSSAPNEVWVVGAFGQVARGPLDNLQMVSLEGTATSTHTTLYGVWGASSDDVWMVGGAPRAPSGPVGTLVHYDGSTFSSVVPTGTASTALEGSLFKVWGSSSDDVTFVGSGGRALVYTGRRWIDTETRTSAQITTVHGRSAFEKYAVGGLNQGIVLQFDGFSWREIGDPFAPPLSGVYAAPDGRVWVAGDAGYLAYWDGEEWTEAELPILTQFHAVWARSGEVFGVGGFLSLSSDPRQGFALRYTEQ